MFHALLYKLSNIWTVYIWAPEYKTTTRSAFLLWQLHMSSSFFVGLPLSIFVRVFETFEIISFNAIFSSHFLPTTEFLLLATNCTTSFSTISTSQDKERPAT